MIKKREIVYTHRHHRMNRSNAIKDIYDALVEIITNCDDSYHRLSRNGGDIFVTIEERRRGNKPSLIVIRDRAEGMTLKDMDLKLGNVGDRTAGEGSRGFMARGLRDCLALGGIKVESIVNGRYYACELRSDNDRDMFVPITEERGRKADESVRTRMGVKKNGTTITLQYAHAASLPKIASIAERLPWHYALRDILSSGRGGKIQIKEGGQKITLASPELHGEKTIDESFGIEGYPDADARLRIWRAGSPLSDDAPRRRMRKSGILVVGGRAIHQCTLLDYENNDAASRYYGRLDCGHIQRLLDEYDNRTSAGQKHPAENPDVLIDPNRQTGLNAEHPFAKKLFAEINRRLKALVDADKAKSAHNQGDITNAEMRKRFSKLAKFTDKFFKDHVDEAPAGDQEAIEAARDKGVYILPPTFNVGAGKTRSLTVYVSKEHYSPKRKTRVHSDNDNAVKLVTTFSVNRLRQHQRYADIFTGSFKVQGGMTPGETATITVRPSKQSRATATGVVKEKYNENWRDFQSPLEFERKAYNISENKSKSVKLFAEMDKMTGGDMVAHVSCPADKNNALAIKGGGQCRLTPVSGTNYAEGEIQIQGREVTPRTLKIQAHMGELNADAKVRVVAPKLSKGEFDFRIVDSDVGLGESRAGWDRENNNPNLLLIAGTHPSIARYFGDPPDFPEQTSEAACAVLAEIITDSVCLRVLREEMVQRSGDFDYSSDEPYEILDDVGKNLRGKIHVFSVQAHKILVRGG